jgi:hypothetical protein
MLRKAEITCQEMLFSSTAIAPGIGRLGEAPTRFWQCVW